MFFSFVIDVFSRRVVGWQFARAHAHRPRSRRPADGADAPPRGRRRRPRAPLRCRQPRRIQRSSQHSIGGVAMGESRRAADAELGRPAMRSPGRAAGRAAASIVSGSGRRSRAGRRARTLPCRPGCRRRLASGGFGRVAGCRPSRCPRRRGGTCRLPSARRSLFCAPGRRGQGDRASARPLAVDDLAGAATQRRDARRRAGVPGDDRAVACRHAGAAPQARRSSP